MNYPTLSDLNSESIVPVAGGKKPSETGGIAVLVSSDQDFKNIRSNSLKPESSNFYFSTLFTDKDKIAYAGPYIGAPYGVVLLESLVAKGFSKILVLGWCGSVSDEMNAGDIIIPSAAISDEGTSRNYTNIDEHFPTIKPSASLSVVLADKLDEMGIGYVNRIIWTTDAIFRETPEKVEFFRQKGACAVEMECSALFAAARYRNVEIASLLVVSDEIKCTESIREWVPGFHKKEFKEARKKACKAIVGFAKDLSSRDD
jgi:purine-nucleoside phosphorylase